jgi:hypothetical protein
MSALPRHPEEIHPALWRASQIHETSASWWAFRMSLIDPLRTLDEAPSQRQLSRDVVEKVGVELFAKFSRVVLPLTDASERRVGRSEGSIFPPAG